MLDMSEYFYRDMELKDFYILDKLGADGMYFFPSGLQVITCYGIESVFGGMEGWSIDEYMVMNSQPQYAASPAESQESFLRVMGHSLISNWVDWESMSCSFDDGEFAKLLEFAAGLPQDESLDQTDASRMLEVSGGGACCTTGSGSQARTNTATWSGRPRPSSASSAIPRRMGAAAASSIWQGSAGYARARNILMRPGSS